jgi:hypothetical protein
MKEFNSQICTTKEQSQRLLELGLKPETADMAHIAFGGGGMMTRPYNWLCTTEVDIENFYPAWSLHRLLCMLDYDNADTFNIMPNLAYEDVIATISLRVGCGAFNKEYLKQ